MINRKEHNKIVDTLIARIEDLEAQLAAKDEIMNMLVASNERKQKHINKLRKAGE